MEKIIFRDNLHFAAYNHPELVFYSYHINAFDWPILHGHQDYWEFTILTEGEIENHIDGKIQYWHKGNVAVATPENSHYLKKACTGGVSYINVMGREDHIKAALDAISTDLYPQLKKGGMMFTISESAIAQIQDLLHKANFYVMNKPEDFNKCVGSACMLLVQSLVAHIMDLGAPSNDFQSRLYTLSLKPEFLLYTIDDLCRDLHYSRVQLYRLFKTNYNTTPHDYLLAHKLSYANSLLFSTDLSTMDIAAKVGFSNLSQFNVDFKKEFGTTPGQCRKMKEH